MNPLHEKSCNAEIEIVRPNGWPRPDSGNVHLGRIGDGTNAFGDQWNLAQSRWNGCRQNGRLRWTIVRLDQLGKPGSLARR